MEDIKIPQPCGAAGATNGSMVTNTPLRTHSDCVVDRGIDNDSEMSSCRLDRCMLQEEINAWRILKYPNHVVLQEQPMARWLPTRLCGPILIVL